MCNWRCSNVKDAGIRSTGRASSSRASGRTWKENDKDIRHRVNRKGKAMTDRGRPDSALSRPKRQFTPRSLATFLAFCLSFSSLAVALSEKASARALWRIAQQPAQAPREAGAKADDERETRLLEPGKAIKRGLAGADSHIYQIVLSADQFLKVIIEQQGIDVVAQLSGPDGEQIAEFDEESRNQGQELASFVAEANGVYWLTVRPRLKNAPAGGYEIRIEELRAAKDNDRALQEARKLYKKAIDLRSAAKYDEALPYFEGALEIRERILGPDHLDVSQAITGLATNHYFKGEYSKAEPLYQRALAIREKSLGLEHPEFAQSLNNLAIIYFKMGDYEKAEPLYQRALAIKEISLGPEHPDVAWSLNGLAVLYMSLGDYAKAKPLYQRALAIREKSLGPEHPDVAEFLNNLANLYRNLGDYAKAEPLYRRALAIKEKSLGPEHPDISYFLNNLAILYMSLGDYAKAEPLYQRALAIREKSLGPEHPNVATSLNNLANIYWDLGNYAKAEPLYQRALAIREKSLGPDHPEVATSLNNLANIYWNLGDYAKAEPFYQRALAILEKAFGPVHPYIAKCLGGMALFYAAKGDFAQAVTVQARANSVVERNLASNLGAGSERQKLAYLALFSKQTDFTLSLHSQAFPHDPQALDLAFTTLLRRKGRGLDAMADTIGALRRRAAPEDQARFDQLAEARSQLAALALKELGTDKPEIYRARFTSLKDKVEDLESALSARSPDFRAQPV